MEIDPVRDEAESYGQALAAAGVPTNMVRIPGLVHAALNMSAYVARADDISRAIVDFLAPRFAAALDSTRELV